MDGSFESDEEEEKEEVDDDWGMLKQDMEEKEDDNEEQKVPEEVKEDKLNKSWNLSQISVPLSKNKNLQQPTQGQNKSKRRGKQGSQVRDRPAGATSPILSPVLSPQEAIENVTKKNDVEVINKIFKEDGG